MRALLKMSDVCSFGDTSRASGNIIVVSDCQLTTVYFAQDGDLWARTAESKQRLPQLF
jgi:hypothetical protein